MRLRFASTATAVSYGLCCVAPAFAADKSTLDEVVVSATVWREQAQIEVPASLTVLTAQTLSDSGQQHFQDVLAQVPNLNWASGSSRPRYFQIRGIGEREQYEGAPNSSVGFLIDDIDFSGVGMAATLFDIGQIEVLRGPQGTRYGANALAGLIAVRSADPQDEFGGYAVADAGNYSTRAIGAAVTGPIESLNSAWRLSVQQYRSDGFRENSYLQRDDTNNRDELTARGKWRWHASEHSQVDVTFLHANLANGYDAFAIDNSRTTLSDKPGQDSQRADAGAIKWNYDFDAGSSATLIATLLQSNSVHAYDSDWGNAQSWSPYTYDYVYRAERERQGETVEARFTAAPLSGNGVTWLAGVYVAQLREHINEISQGVFVDPDPIDGYASSTDDYLDSRFDANTAAIFGQLDGQVANHWLWSIGARGEHRAADYRDTRPTDTQRTDSMIGGQASLSYLLTERARMYATVARGYKAGGFNLGQANQRQPEFNPEYLWNYELGAKFDSQDGKWYADVALFYMQRKNMQMRTGEQLDPGDPNSYIFVTTNVAHGYNYGLESTVHWLPIKSLELGASLGLLRTWQSDSLNEDGDYVAPRAQAYSPEYQWQLNATYRHVHGFMARIDYSSTAAFYFDVPSDHDQQSTSHTLVNVKAGYEADRWQLYGWVRNAFDTNYANRGFYFGNEPPAWEDKLYTQSGDPRQYGLTVQWKF